MKINLVKVASIGGAALSIAATLVSNYSNKKSMDETIAKEVAKALENQKNS